MELERLVGDLADALQAVDAGQARHKNFQPGIGPFGEAQAVSSALAVLKSSKPAVYSSAVVKRIPDLLIPGRWAVEFKIVRPFGDNGKPAEHWSENLLHPYSGNTSSLGDCLKLLDSSFSERKAVVILGFEHYPPQVSLEPVVAAFELLASNVVGVRLGPRIEVMRLNLVHPVHQQMKVIGFEGPRACLKRRGAAPPHGQWRIAYASAVRSVTLPDPSKLPIHPAQSSSRSRA